MDTFEPIADVQDATIRVEYEVGKDTGIRGCLCSACLNESPLDLSTSTSLNDNFRRLFLSPESSDMVFVVGEEKIPAHKFLLTTHVPYFARLFASGKCHLTRHFHVVTDNFFSLTIFRSDLCLCV